MKKILIAILGTFLLTSCIYTAMYHFSNSDLEWMSPYEVGDTILFRSSEGVDTMTVERIKVRDEYLPLMANEASTEMNALGESYKSRTWCGLKTVLCGSLWATILQLKK